MSDCSISIFWEKADVYFNVIFESGIPVRSFFSPTPVNLTDTDSTEALDMRKNLQKYFHGVEIQFDDYIVKRAIQRIKAEMGDFTAKVLKKVSEIPYGEVRTYSEVSGELESSPRAVGQAVKRNPLPVIIPCHRVVSKSGIGGYSCVHLSPGKSITIKRMLLKLEGVETL